MTPSSGVHRINGYNSVRRINSKRVSAVSADWWLAGGIDPANAIAAYQPKGAASYAASKVNLVNPGTYNLAEIGGGPVNWASGVGWSGFSTLSRCLNTTLSNVITSGWSSIVRVTGVSSNSTVILGGYDGAYDGLYYSFATATGFGYFHNVRAQRDVVTATGTGVLAIVTPICYLDGVNVGNLEGAVSANTLARSPYIGAQHYTSATQFINGSIQAVAFYNTQITPAQVLAVSTAIAAL